MMSESAYLQAMFAGLTDHLDHLLIALAAGFLGAFIRGYSGFGFALTAVPVLTLALPPAQAVPAVLPLELLLGLGTIPGQRDHVAWPTMGWLVLGTAIGTPIGIAVLASMPAAVMRLVVGGVVLLSAALLWRRPGMPDMLEPAPLCAAGFTSGLLNGGTAMSGPPVILALLGSGLEPRMARATLMVFVALSAMWAASGAAFGGLYTHRTLSAMLIMLPAVAVGGFAGAALFRFMPHPRYRAASLGILAAITAIAIGTAGWNMARGGPR